MGILTWIWNYFIVWKADLVHRTPPFLRVTAPIARLQKRLLLASKSLNVLRRFDLTNWRHSAMRCKVIFIFEDGVAPVAILWGMAFFEVVPSVAVNIH